MGVGAREVECELLTRRPQRARPRPPSPVSANCCYGSLVSGLALRGAVRCAPSKAKAHRTDRLGRGGAGGRGRARPGPWAASARLASLLLHSPVPPRLSRGLTCDKKKGGFPFRGLQFCFFGLFLCNFLTHSVTLSSRPCRASSPPLPRSAAGGRPGRAGPWARRRRDACDLSRRGVARL